MVYRIEVKADETIKALAGASSALSKARGLWDDIGQSLVTSTRMRFERGVAPSGNPWPPSIRALAEGGKTLIDSARLMNSITHQPTEASVSIGTNVIYAGIQHEGGTIRAKGGGKLAFRLLGAMHFVDQVTIPARPFLGIDEDDEREMRAIAEDWLRRTFDPPEARQ